MIRMLWVVVGWGLSLPAMAGTTLEVGSMTVDGVTVLDLRCDLTGKGGPLASLGIVGGLARQKEALHACAPQGGAAQVKLPGAQGGPVVSWVSDGVKARCVERALAPVPAVAGTCEATVLLGAEDGARAAVASRPGAAKPAPPEPVPEAPPPPKPAGPPDYTNLDAWSVVKNEDMGIQFAAPAGVNPLTATVDIDGVTWSGLHGEHDHQLTWVLQSPGEDFPPALADLLTAKAIQFAEHVDWREVRTGEGVNGSPSFRIDLGVRPPHRVYRVTMVRDGKRAFVLGVATEQFPEAGWAIWLRHLPGIE
jgi:hypothetical protein